MTPVLKQAPPPKQFREPSQEDSFAQLTPLRPFHSLTPNPKERQKLELDFKGLQNYVLSNIDSSEPESESHEFSDLIGEDAIGQGLLSGKPWDVP